MNNTLFTFFVKNCDVLFSASQLLPKVSNTYYTNFVILIDFFTILRYDGWFESRETPRLNEQAL